VNLTRPTNTGVPNALADAISGYGSTILNSSNTTTQIPHEGLGLVAFEVHGDGTRLYRGEHLQVVAHARGMRWTRHRAGVVASRR
jgi:hypothetical protein